jgi:hypothetical protein
MLSTPSPLSAFLFSNPQKFYYYGVVNVILTPSEMTSVLRTPSALLLLFCVPLISARLAFYPLFSEPNAMITRVSHPLQPSTILQLLALLLTHTYSSKAPQASLPIRQTANHPTTIFKVSGQDWKQRTPTSSSKT